MNAELKPVHANIKGGGYLGGEVPSSGFLPKHRAPSIPSGYWKRPSEERRGMKQPPTDCVRKSALRARDLWRGQGIARPCQDSYGLWPCRVKTIDCSQSQVQMCLVANPAADRSTGMGEMGVLLRAVARTAPCSTGLGAC